MLLIIEFKATKCALKLNSLGLQDLFQDVFIHIYLYTDPAQLMVVMLILLIADCEKMCKGKLSYGIKC